MNSLQVDFNSLRAPAGYVAGMGRGAAGFTTRSDIGPSMPAPDMPHDKPKVGIPVVTIPAVLISAKFFNPGFLQQWRPPSPRLHFLWQGSCYSSWVNMIIWGEAWMVASFLASMLWFRSSCCASIALITTGAAQHMGLHAGYGML